MASILDGKAYLSFVDNESAKGCLVSGYSHNSVACSIVAQVCDLDAEAGSFAWFERVPSLSNVADAPSRGEPPAGVVGWLAPVIAVGTHSATATLLRELGCPAAGLEVSV